MGYVRSKRRGPAFWWMMGWVKCDGLNRFWFMMVSNLFVELGSLCFIIGFVPGNFVETQSCWASPSLEIIFWSYETCNGGRRVPHEHKRRYYKNFIPPRGNFQVTQFLEGGCFQWVYFPFLSSESVISCHPDGRFFFLPWKPTTDTTFPIPKQHQLKKIKELTSPRWFSRRDRTWLIPRSLEVTKNSPLNGHKSPSQKRSQTSQKAPDPRPPKPTRTWPVVLLEGHKGQTWYLSSWQPDLFVVLFVIFRGVLKKTKTTAVFSLI